MQNKLLGGYYSRKISDAQTNATTIKKELFSDVEL